MLKDPTVGSTIRVYWCEFVVQSTTCLTLSTILTAKAAAKNVRCLIDVALLTTRTFWVSEADKKLRQQQNLDCATKTEATPTWQAVLSAEANEASHESMQRVWNQMSEDHINASVRRGRSRVTVVNEFDEAVFPWDFTYTNERQFTTDSQEPCFFDSPRKCCACPNLCMVEANCERKWFHKHQPSVPRSLATGSSRVCDKSCRYCLVEKGSHVDVCIFRTPRTGWGVRANKKIAKGEFIEEYTGEVVRFEDIDFDASEDSWYAFSLDRFYDVDARPCGNFTRFVNHSCEPNVVAVGLMPEEEQDGSRIPLRVCLFALADIRPAEQLTLDYNYEVFADRQDPTLSVRCHCGSARCRGYLVRL